MLCRQARSRATENQLHDWQQAVPFYSRQSRS